MNRFSTIKIEIEADFSLDVMTDIWVTFEQGKTKITKKKSEGQLMVDDYICQATLSQAETGLFKAHMPIAVQCRWVDFEGNADSADIGYCTLGDVLEEGVIGV